MLLKQVGDRPCQTDEPSNVKLLAQCLGNVTILRKGSDDIISDGSTGRSVFLSIYLYCDSFIII